MDVVAVLHDVTARDKHVLHQRIAAGEDPAVERGVFGPPSKQRVIGVEHGDVTAEAGGDGADRPARPETADPTRPKAPAGQSHIRAARPKTPQARLPETGPMADMLRKIFNKDGNGTS